VLVVLVLLVVLPGAIGIGTRGAARPALLVIFSRQGIAARQVHRSRSRYLSRTFASVHGDAKLRYGGAYL
jgi:hypothetical protein